jgi:phospholipid-binding lipoprotein MlaA
MWVRATAVISLLGTAACATVPAGPAASGYQAAAQPAAIHSAAVDPFEGLNRRLFGLGRGFDRRIIQPILGGYSSVVPGPLRRSVHNVLQNAGEPVVFINDILQAHFSAGARTAVRFAGNSTIGLIGIFDPVSRAGLPHHDNGFGTTLGRYGAGPGPYFYIPLIGPTDLRDAIGAGVDLVSDPLPWGRLRDARAVRTTMTVLSLVDERLDAEKDLQTLEKVAADPYATLRSVYLQSRKAEIAGPDAEFEALPEFPPEPAAAPPATPPPQPAPAAPQPAESAPRSDSPAPAPAPLSEPLF